MTEDVDNQQLRAIRAGNDKTHQMLFDLTQRVASLEQKAAFAAVDLANVSVRMDGIAKGISRLEDFVMVSQAEMPRKFAEIAALVMREELEKRNGR